MKRESAPAADKDQYGLAPYDIRYPLSAAAAGDASTRLHIRSGTVADQLTVTALSVPWDTRHSSAHSTERQCESLQFLVSSEWWSVVFYALRVACIGTLPIAALLSLNSSGSVFVSRIFGIFGALVSSHPTFGQAMQYAAQFLKGACIWLPVATAAAALELYKYPVAWAFAYIGVLFCLGLFMDGMTRKMSLVLFNICMISQPQNSYVTYPSRVFVDWVIGTFIGVCVSLLPIPSLAATRAQSAIISVATDIAICFDGLSNSFWCATNLQRNINLMKVRFILEEVGRNVAAANKSNGDSMYELLLDSSEKRQLRSLKLRLLENLISNVKIMRRLVEMITERPKVLTNSVRAASFGADLVPEIRIISSIMNEALLWFSRAETVEELRLCIVHFERLQKAVEKMDATFARSRRHNFYGNVLSGLEEFVPLMSTFMFSIGQCNTTVQDFGRKILMANAVEPIHSVALQFLLHPILQTYAGMTRMLFAFGEEDKHICIESFRTSAAMLIAVGFFFLIDSNTALLTGPTIIAFVSSLNHSEAVLGSILRLVGTLLGAVIGFFAASLTTIPRDRVAVLCVVVFIFSMFRQNTSVGPAAVYSAFVAVAQIPVVITTQDPSNTISRIQQNTFAVLIYVAVSIFVLPSRPRDMLAAKRAQVLAEVAQTLHPLMMLFSVPVHSKADIEKSKAPRIQEQTGDREPTGQPSEEELYSLTAAHYANEVSLLTEARSAVLRFRQHLGAEGGLVPLTENEPRMHSVAFPARANHSIHDTHVNMAANMETIIQAWGVIRRRDQPPSAQLVQMLEYLTPIAHDIANCTKQLTHILTQEILHFGRSGLTGELEKKSLELSFMCRELHLRKSHIFLHTVQKATEHFDTSAGEASQEPPEPYGFDTIIPPSTTGSTSMHSSYGERNELLPQVFPTGRRVQLPDNFQPPISLEDTNGFHTLTFSVVLFAAEFRKLLVDVQEVNQHWKS